MAYRAEPTNSKGMRGNREPIIWQREMGSDKICLLCDVYKMDRDYKGNPSHPKLSTEAHTMKIDSKTNAPTLT